MRWKRRLFHEEIVKWSVIKIIRLQIYVIALEINENIKPFEEIVTNHTVYVFFTLHPGREGRKCTIMLPQKRTGLERKIVTKKRYADMGNNSRKQHGPEFKAKVALEALKEQATLPELEKKFGVSQYTISRWKNELLRNASQTFGATNDEEAHQKEVDNLHRKIGELEMMLDFAKRASRKLGVRLPEDL